MTELKNVEADLSRFRIRVLTGDLADPRLGLDDDHYATLAHDVDSWRQLPAPNHYAQLDAISYHGLTGYLPADNPDPGMNCGLPKLPLVDTASIQRRVTEHRGKHNAKSLICSTDAVRDFPQVNARFDDEAGWLIGNAHTAAGRLLPLGDGAGARDPASRRRAESGTDNSSNALGRSSTKSKKKA